MLNFIQIFGRTFKRMTPTEDLYFSNTGEIGESILPEPSGRSAVSQEGQRTGAKDRGNGVCLEKRLIALETLKVDISDEVTKLKDQLGEVRTTNSRSKSLVFRLRQFDQLKQRLNQEVQKELDTFSSDFDSGKNETGEVPRGLLIYNTSPTDRSFHYSSLQDATYAWMTRCQNAPGAMSVCFFSRHEAEPVFRKSGSNLVSWTERSKCRWGLAEAWLKKDPGPGFSQP